MPNTKSAKKRLKQNLERRARNRSVKSALNTQVKKVLSALAAGDVAQAEAEFRGAQHQLDQAGARRTIHPNAAARTKSRISARIKAAKHSPAKAAK